MVPDHQIRGSRPSADLVVFLFGEADLLQAKDLERECRAEGRSDWPSSPEQTKGLVDGRKDAQMYAITKLVRGEQTTQGLRRLLSTPARANGRRNGE
jgi:hypothetical protein